MRLQEILLDLLSGISDPVVRVDVASTISFLSQVYRMGKATEEQITNDLREIVREVITMKNPTLAPDELKKIVNDYVSRLMMAIKGESVFTRFGRKYQI